jgi:hypothetical protein
MIVKSSRDSLNLPVKRQNNLRYPLRFQLRIAAQKGLRINGLQIVIPFGSPTPMPRFLFDYEIRGLPGTIVVDPQNAFRFISQGATFQEIREVRRVTMLRE